MRRAGYADQDGKSPHGQLPLFEGGIEIKPGPDSYHSPESAIIRIRGGKVESITSKAGDLAAYELEPQMITSLVRCRAALQARNWSPMTRFPS